MTSYLNSIWLLKASDAREGGAAASDAAEPAALVVVVLVAVVVVVVVAAVADVPARGLLATGVALLAAPTGPTVAVPAAPDVATVAAAVAVVAEDFDRRVDEEEAAETAAFLASRGFLSRDAEDDDAWTAPPPPLVALGAVLVAPAAPPRLSLLLDLAAAVDGFIGCMDRETRSTAAVAAAEADEVIVLGLVPETDTGRSDAGGATDSLAGLASGESKARATLDCCCCRSAEEGAATDKAFKPGLGGADGLASFLVRFRRGGVLPTE
jgi:hypothetical protein